MNDNHLLIHPVIKTAYIQICFILEDHIPSVSFKKKYYEEKFVDIKGEIRSRKSKKDRQLNDQKKKDKQC